MHDIYNFKQIVCIMYFLSLFFNCSSHLLHNELQKHPWSGGSEIYHILVMYIPLLQKKIIL